ncbi:MAG: fumarylacetoacetate hydrolase family protein [Armatimonadota bacterium]|nr:fumarylacetoacetate hydrolase family protein [Armatimonadota bacterium]MDR7486697.1 fumarylacetoacetate hydrolase family protein [Armatimonadota bacterium]MDR7533743.1 fumarylacetoacetate hydrolase family protein [Armatimonadota bacterium]MDR7535050.1 fumarylacetoacetate hydrolase family protein [Armatimonadota bacterium]
MRLVLFDDGRGPRPGVLDGDDVIRDVGDRFGTLSAALAALHDAPDDFQTALARGTVVPRARARLLAPVDRMAQVLCVAANYREHAEEAGLGGVPPQPVLFVKLWTALTGPEDPIRLSPLTRQLDYEAELVAVVGRVARAVAAAEALRHVGGYTVMNDISARDLQWTQLGQHRIVDWYSAKCLEASTPVGPWIVTSDEVPDPQRLRIRSWVNGVLRQDETTALMVHPIGALVAYASLRTTLYPGDLIATGTPRGVGGFAGRFLQEGDVVEVDVDGIGRLANRVQRAG